VADLKRAVRRWGPFLLVIGVCACRRREQVVTIGDRGGVQGGGFTMDISREFGPASLLALYERVTSEETRNALSEFTCGDPVPAMRYELRLKPSGTWNERLVNVGYAPDLDGSFKDRCLTKGISYVFNQALQEIDLGPPIDYGYVDPHTGKPLGALPRTKPQKPICRCDVRGAGREWVAHSEKAAAELQ